MSTPLMNRLMVHAPENVVADWAFYNNTVPTDLWPDSGPSVEVGMAMLKGKAATQVADFVKYFTNPDLLDEIARTDDRVRVAHALVENRRMTYDGYKTLLEKHRRRGSIIQRIRDNGTSLSLHEASDLGLPIPRDGLVSEAQRVGLLGAMATGEEYPHLVDGLLREYIGRPNINTTPRATHAEILEAFLQYYSTDEGSTEGLVVPEGTERWLVEVPGAAVKILHAIVEGSSSPHGGYRRVLSELLSNLPEDLDGPVPDVKKLLDRHPEGAAQYAAGLASDILSAWFQKRPATVGELEHLQEVLDSITGKIVDGRFFRSNVSTLYVTPETLLDSGRGTNPYFELRVRRPLAAANAVLDQEGAPATTKFLQVEKLLEAGITQESLEGLSEGVVRQQVLALTEKVIRELPNTDQPLAARVLVSFQSSEKVWHEVLESPHVGVILDFFADLILLGVGDGMVRNLPAELSSDLRSRVYVRLQSDECDDFAWDFGAKYLLETEIGCATQNDLFGLGYDRYMRVIVEPALLGSSTFSAHREISSADESLKDVVPVALKESEDGDPSKLNELLKVVVKSEDRMVNYTVRARLAVSEHGVMSGAFPLKEVLGHHESFEVIANLFEKQFGDDTSRWQLATEMAEDWEGTMPELLEVVEAME